ncbi:hypothetical protein [Plebeiibacterium marinum]|uniref:Uncharacterized protein n=1 Tax=Plebeiibacterium marinum TaxID=2992111 RepID=A0AAE3SID6_9BACT|nr:hypothetical protein [Plebeiobacterium marinum]MCW3804517.1 hypothetical protein [Plebeiobacterium marinum]
MKLISLYVLFFNLIAIVATGQNPFLPPTAFIPDGEPHVFTYKGEERLFVYGSRDEIVTDYCGYGHDVWSAPVDDLTKWTNHGEIFNIQQIKDIGYGKIEGANLGAPDCVYNPQTRKYYLYTFMLKRYRMDGIQGPASDDEDFIPGYADYGPACIVAESESPIGPFTNPIICDWPSATEDGTFDPSILVDEHSNGNIDVYAYWGNCYGDRWTKINVKDMHSIIHPYTGKSMVNRQTRHVWQASPYKTLNNPSLNGKYTLFEASSIKKVATGKYVFIFSPNENHSSLVYCYSKSPEGPWNYGGTIVNNRNGWEFGNNHGSIVKVKDQWYVIYHRKTDNSYNRQAMIEPIDLKIEGDKVIISQVEMTSQGIFTNGLNAFRRYNANTICYKTARIKIAGSQRCSDGLNPLIGIQSENDSVGIKYLNFGDKKIQDKDHLNLRLNLKLISPEASLTLWVVPEVDFNDETKRIKLGSFKLSNYVSADGNYHEISLQVEDLDHNQSLNHIGGLKGKLGVMMSFNGCVEGMEICRIKEYEFAKGNDPTPNPLHSIVIKNTNKYAQVSVIPTKARLGESVKVVIEPDEGYQYSNVKVSTTNGRKDVLVNPNNKSQYAPQNFNFVMPDEEVVISVKCIKQK